MLNLNYDLSISIWRHKMKLNLPVQFIDSTSPLATPNTLLLSPSQTGLSKEKHNYNGEKK
jgi:hypothetical protein